MNIGTGPEATFRDGCLALRASTLDKIRAPQSPGFSGQVPNGLGKQPLSNFRLVRAFGSCGTSAFASVGFWPTSAFLEGDGALCYHNCQA